MFSRMADLAHHCLVHPVQHASEGGMARQSWRERRGDQDEKRQPYQIIDRAEPAPTQARSNSAAL